MQERNLFEFAVIRLVPRVEREEFINVGVVLYCKKEKFLEVKFHWEEDRLKAFAPNLDMETMTEHLYAFERICRGDKDGGAIAQLDAASRFRWLTATRSTIIQTSKVHPGLCLKAGDCLDKILSEQVLIGL